MWKAKNKEEKKSIMKKRNEEKSCRREETGAGRGFNFSRAIFRDVDDEE